MIANNPYEIHSIVCGECKTKIDLSGPTPAPLASESPCCLTALGAYSNEITMAEYQRRALATAIYPREHAIMYPALKLVSEAGEVAGKVGNWLRGDYNKDSMRFEARKELGDVLWYVAALAHDLHLDLGQIAIMNNEKLADRAARGVIKGSGDNR